MEKLDCAILKEAAELIEQHAKHLSRGRVEVSYNPVLVDALQAAAYLFRDLCEKAEELGTRRYGEIITGGEKDEK